MSSSLSTPLSISYEDSPDANLTYLKSLSENELKLYAQGYIQSSSHVQEAIVDAKHQFLNAILLYPDDKNLQNYVKLLDTLENTVKNKVQVLKTYWPNEDL